jgi:Sodium:solute symporter family
LLRLHVNPLDYTILGIYFALVVAIGVIVRRAVATSEDFLLSGRALPAWITGLAFISANLGAIEILGMAANGAQYGLPTVHFYWIGAVPAMVFLGVVMMPFYYGSRVRSVPEFLLRRFNPPTHLFNALTFALAAVLIAGVNLFALALVVNALIGWPIWVSIVVSAGFVLAYITLGGLSGAIYNEVLQFFVARPRESSPTTTSGWASACSSSPCSSSHGGGSARCAATSRRTIKPPERAMVKPRLRCASNAPVPPATSWSPKLNTPRPARKIWTHPASRKASSSQRYPASAYLRGPLGSVPLDWSCVVSLMLATLGRGVGRPKHVRRSAGCGEPPGGVAAGHIGVSGGRPHNGTRVAVAGLTRPCITCERLREADVHVEVSEPQMQDSAAGPVHDVCQQDDDQDDDHQPEEEHDDSGDDVPSYSSRSSHGLQLPGAARIIRNGRGRSGVTPAHPAMPF